MKRNTFIKFVILLLSVSMLLSLFACAPDDPKDPTDDTTQQETEPVANETDRQTEEPTKSSTEGETASEPETSPSITETEATVSTETETPTEEKTDDESESDGESVSEAETIDESNTDEKETEEMQTEAIRDDLASVGVYDKYDLDSYMSPIWSGKVIHNETVMFVGIDDKASLLYDADRILSVRSYDLSIEYVQGVDYDYVDGKLVLLEGTRIPYVPLETYYSVLDPQYPYLSTMYNGQVTQTMFGDGTTMTQWQVAVTYKHSDTWEGKVVESYEDRFASFINKLENGEDVTVFFYGDSITTGATSSQSRAPYAPSYPRMFVQYVAKQYGYTVKYVDSYSNDMLTNGKPGGGGAHEDTVFGTNGTITYINTAVGGWSTQQGVDNLKNYVLNYINAFGCDLFVLAFGMNNGGSEASAVVQYMRQIVQGVVRSAPNTGVVLVSTMIPNPEAVRNPADKYFCNGNQYTFEEKMYPLADGLNKTLDGGCAVAPMTSVSQYIHSQKRYRDTTGNNVNHPSDFLARTYAQVIYQTVFGYENYAKAPTELGETPVVDANYNAEITVGENKLYLDGKAGTTNANFASCVRLEATDGGFFMYHVSNGLHEYINVNTSGEIEYSDEAKTVWTYNATIKAMVCDGAELALTLVTPEICMHPFVSEGETHSREVCARCEVNTESAPHEFIEKTTVNPDGSSTHAEVCAECGYIKSSYTTGAPEKPDGSDGDKTEGETGGAGDEIETEGSDGEIETEATGGSASVGVHDQFDLDSYMTPVWDGKVVHNETVLFVGPDDTPALLYSPDRIISVRSYDLSIEYIEGIDFEIVGNKIVRLEGSRIPYIPLETYYSVHNDMPYLSTMVNGVVTQTMFGEGSTICKWQIAITYKHSGTWEGVELKSYTDRYASLIEKLEAGEDVTFHFYGDSITAGGNASSAVGMSPYTPIWAKMLTQYVAKQYGYTIRYVSGLETSTLDKTYGENGVITYINTAVGGWNTQQGRDNFEEKVKAYAEIYGCDLFILAFGMNNGSINADLFCTYLNEIVVKFEECAPNADLLLVSTMLPNPEAVRNPADKFFCNGIQPTFEEKMIPLAETINNRGTNCALARMTSVTEYLYTIKKFRDTTGNNVNHPSDFVVRLYAQTLFQTVFGYENYKEEYVEIENKPAENVNFNAAMTVSGNKIYLDGKDGTANKNYAVCVRFEKNADGYYMYFVDNNAKVYVNADNGAILYSDTAESVWVYDESSRAVVSGDVSIKLSAPEICLHPTVSGEETHGREACLRCGVEANVEAHEMVDGTVENADGSITYITTCKNCGAVGRSYTVPAEVIYYSGSATNRFYQFFMLDKEAMSEGGIGFTRVSASVEYAGHELHWINQNDDDHCDSAGNKLDTKGNKYLVLRLRAGSDEMKMYFIYKLLGAGSKTVSIPVITEDEWFTYVIDLESVSPDIYKELSDGTYTMQTFKIQISSGFDKIENGYLDVAYLALCDNFGQIKTIAGAETVQLMATSGKLTEVMSDGTCKGEHTVSETVEGTSYTAACSVCGKVIASKTLPEGINYYAGFYKLNNNANGASLINYAEVIEEDGESFCRVYGGASQEKYNYNEFTVYSNSSASLVTGQYLVIKYRVGQNALPQNQFTIFAGTENSAPTSEKEHMTLTPNGGVIEDGEWHIAVIDMSTMAHNTSSENGFLQDDDGLYRAKFVAVRPFWPNALNRSDENDYTDFAFAAICDSIEKAEALIGSGSYEYYTTSSTPTVVNITE